MAASGITVRRQSSPIKDVITQAMEDADKLVCQVGWFSSTMYPNGTPVAYVAAIQEYGYPPKNIPPRLGLRETTKEQADAWQQLATKLGKRIFAGKMTMYDALTLIGAVAEGDFRKHISKVTSPPLAESTLKRRAARLGISSSELTKTGAKPLVDTGYLLATITHLVTDAPEDRFTHVYNGKP